jgi:hypothetical protein
VSLDLHLTKSDENGKQKDEKQKEKRTSDSTVEGLCNIYLYIVLKLNFMKEVEQYLTSRAML